MSTEIVHGNKPFRTDVEIVPQRVYKLTDAQVDHARERLHHLNKIAAKLNVPEITLEIVDTRIQTIEFEGRTATMMLNDCIVHGTEPRLAGWEFVATIQHESGGNVIRRMRAEGDDHRGEVDLDNMRYIEPNCDHCGIKRKRKDTYIVRNTETGAVRQVGSSCISDFLGHGNPQQIVALIEAITNFLDDADDDIISFGGYGTGEPLTNLVVFLEHVAATIDKHGWVSAKNAEQAHKESTKTIAERSYFDAISSSRERTMRAFEITNEHHETAVNTIAYIRGQFRDDTLKERSINEYVHNLIVVCSDDFIKYRSMGIAASAISIYNHHREGEIKKTLPTVSKHVGQVGDSGTFSNLVCTRIHPHTSELYGTTYFHTFVDTHGNIFEWSTKKMLAVADTYSLRGTIKGHTEFRGEPRTAITKCRVLSGTVVIE